MTCGAALAPAVDPGTGVKVRFPIHSEIQPGCRLCLSLLAHIWLHFTHPIHLRRKVERLRRKGVAGAGRPPSLLAVATLMAQSST
jgi:hypothetical protein